MAAASAILAERDRRHLAHLLHDDVVQSLTAAMLRLELAASTGATEDLRASRAAVDDAVRSLRRTMAALAPAGADVGRLRPALRSHVDDALPDSVRAEVVLADAVDDVPHGIAVLTLHLVQDLLTAASAAGARSLLVEVWCADGAVHGRMTSDVPMVDVPLPDGRAADVVDEHLGSAQARARLGGGDLEIRACGAAPRPYGITWSVPGHLGSD